MKLYFKLLRLNQRECIKGCEGNNNIIECDNKLTEKSRIITLK